MTLLLEPYVDKFVWESCIFAKERARERDCVCVCSTASFTSDECSEQMGHERMNRKASRDSINGPQHVALIMKQ